MSNLFDVGNPVTMFGLKMERVPFLLSIFTNTKQEEGTAAEIVSLILDSDLEVNEKCFLSFMVREFFIVQQLNESLSDIDV